MAPSSLVLVPVLDYVLAKKVELPDTPGGLYIHDAGVGKPEYAEVLAVGPGRSSEYSGSPLPPPPCQVRDTIMVHAGAGTKFRFQGEDRWWLLPTNILAVVKVKVEGVQGSDGGLVPLKDLAVFT